ncbi:MAG: hypothetical protein ACRDQ7_01565 [Haloechinothrix sp.]
MARSWGAVAVVRVWFEPTSTGSTFRARITYNSEPHGPACSVVLSEPSTVLDTLSAWFEVHCAAHGIGNDTEQDGA